MQIACVAFKGAALTPEEVSAAVRKVRRRRYAEHRRKAKSRR